MTTNIVWLGLGIYLLFYWLFRYNKTRDWFHLLIVLLALSFFPISIMKVLGIPVVPLMLSHDWWRYVILGLQVLGLVIVVVKFVSDSVQERP